MCAALSRKHKNLQPASEQIDAALAQRILFISGVGFTPEERLLRTGQFATDFFYFGNLSFRFRFGSKFANVVNLRMDF